MPAARLAFHGLFNSKPFGATGLSVCPLKYPVNLESLSITVYGQSLALARRSERVYFAITLLVSPSPLTENTHLVPRINTMSPFLAAALNGFEYCEPAARNAKHLHQQALVGIQLRGRGIAHGKHDPVGEQCFEGNTHCDKKGRVFRLLSQRRRGRSC